jgi:hypothetical protein|tara:strand:+ start:32 stop:520 length:489 start_codon:yes stop_codon:yes gene_type:complete
MEYTERTGLIGSWLQSLLRRYKPPSDMDNDTLGEELKLIVEDINSNIPSMLTRVEVQIILKKIDGHVRAYQASRSWPTIKTFIESTKKSVEDYSRNTGDSKVTTHPLGLSDDQLTVKRIKMGHSIAASLLDVDSPTRQRLLEETDLVESDFNKYLDPAAITQ